MKSRILIGVLGGVAAGLLAAWLLRPDSPDTQLESKAARVAQLEAELKGKTREVERLAKAAETTGAAAKTGEKDTPAFDPKSPEVVKMQERMKKQMLEKQKLKLDERMAVLRTRLGLNDEQAAAVRELLEKNPTGPQSLMAQAMSGAEVDEGEMALSMLRPGRKEAEVAEKLAALLTPDQQQAYIAFRQEQRTNDVEIKANKELARLQSSLTLTPEQKDKAFTLLTGFANEEYDNPVSPMAGMIVQQMEKVQNLPENKKLEPHMDEIKTAAALAGERRRQRVEAMREILSPEQLRLYEDQQKHGSMAEFMDGAFDDMSGVMFGAGADDAGAVEVPPPPAPVEEVKSK